MANESHADGLQLRSTVKSDGTLDIALVRVPTPQPQADEVVVRIDAAPLNPSDMALLLAGADLTTLRSAGNSDEPRVTAKIAPEVLRMLGARLDQALPVGNEGAGVVVATGSAPDAKTLMGKTVSTIGGGMYAQYRVLHKAQVQALPAGTTAEEGASWFVNPLTALAMLETMKAEGHTALAHTAAASNLGQMLQKACLEDGIQLVNIVRKQEQADILRKLGATYVCDSSAPNFMQQLIEAFEKTGATIAFDAIGGGSQGSQILTAMEIAAGRKAGGPYNRYGTNVHKQLYIYGGLDRSPTQLTRSFGFAWGVGGFLLTPFLQKAGDATVKRLRERVANGLKTTFASTYGARVSLRDALKPELITEYGKQSTGAKYLIKPNA